MPFWKALAGGGGASGKAHIFEMPVTEASPPPPAATARPQHLDPMLSGSHCPTPRLRVACPCLDTPWEPGLCLAPSGGVKGGSIQHQQRGAGIDICSAQGQQE